MVRHHRLTSLVALLTVLLAACESTTSDGLNPAAPSSLASLLTGGLSSIDSGDLVPSAESCSDFQWSITEVDGGMYSGDFSATCADDIQLDGTATGTLVGDVLTITASGTATPKDLPSCAFTLNGTAQLVGDTIRIDYTGTTCLGPISGTEILASN